MNIVEYHGSSSDEEYLPWSASREDFYGYFEGYPTVWFDGTYRHVGASNPEAMAAAYRVSINNRLAVNSPIQMSGTFSYSSSTITLTATARKVDAVNLTQPILIMAVLEDDMFWGGRPYNHVVRAGGGRAISLPNQGDETTVTMDFTVGPTWNLDNIRCVAWVQKNVTNFEVYQSCELSEFFDFTLDVDDPLASIPEGNGQAIFEGNVTNQLEVAQNLTVSLQNTFGWPADFMLDGEADFHTDPSSISLDPGEAIGFTMRVTTDGQVRVGTGSMRAQSTQSTMTKQCRVFNGGLAVLFVDDDGAYPQTDELPLLDALAARNILYDHWDVRRGYGRAPNAAEMAQYDAAIWHVGVQTNMVLESDVEVMTQYLQEGGSLILSYQHFLTFADTCQAPVVAEFLTDYLGLASYVQDAGADSALGVAGDAISDGMDMRFNWPSPSWDKCDALTPNALGQAFLHSSTGNQIAIRAQNLDHDSRTVFFACLLNQLSNTPPDPDNLGTLLQRSIEWVVDRGSASVADGRMTGPSSIRWIAPNPLRASATASGASIRLRVGDSAAGRPARLDIFDVNGRLISNLLDGPLPAGMMTATWNGLDASGSPAGSGMYYLRFTTADGTDRARVAVIR